MSFLSLREQVAPQGIGKPVRRREDARFLTGGGRFADDMSLPGQVYEVCELSVTSDESRREKPRTEAGRVLEIQSYPDGIGARCACTAVALEGRSSPIRLIPWSARTRRAGALGRRVPSVLDHPKLVADHSLPAS